MSFDSEPVTRLTITTPTGEQKEIVLVGTAHVSEASVTLVEKVIREEHPDSVAIELDDQRLKALENPDKWRNTDIVQVFKEGRIYSLLAQILISTYQKKLGAHLKVLPGAEMTKAAQIARETNAAISLADRDVKITLKRVWAALTFWQKMKLLAGMLHSILDVEAISQQDIERLKASDVLAEAMKEFSEKFPGVKAALIDERDKYLAAKIKESPGQKVVAVVGAGHCPGITKWIHETYSLEPLMAIPEQTIGQKITKSIIPLLLAALIIGGFFMGKDIGTSMIIQWSLINFFAAAIGATIAFAHPVAILLGALSAPFTPLHPLLASGFISGFFEAVYRKPLVADFESVAEDINTVKGIWKNRVLRIFLVVLLTNATGAIGAISAVWILASKL